MGIENLSRNINKIKSFHANHGSWIVLKKIGHLAFNKLVSPPQKKTLASRIRLFNTIDKAILRQDIDRIFSEGLLRPLDKIKADINSLSGEYADKIIVEADRIVENHFVLYGSLKVQLDEEGGWWRDPLTRYLWPHTISAANILSKKPEGTDIKNIWEIARFQFLSSLAYAYIFTCDDKYARFAIGKVNSWIEENDFPYGPLWTRAMEVSIRLINWCVYLPLLDSFKFLDPHFLSRLTESILEHLIYIRENLEISVPHSNNHYLANLVALLLGRLIFPSSEWCVEGTEFAEKELEREIKEQFRESGINFEGSLAYHRLSSEISLVGAAILKQSGKPLPSSIVERLRQVTNFTRYYTNLSNECPLIGDNDSGIFVKFFPGQEFNRHQYLRILFDLLVEDRIQPNDTEEFLCAVHFTDPHSWAKARDYVQNTHSSITLEVRNFDGLVIGRHKADGLFFNTLDVSEGHAHNDKLAIYPVIARKLIFLDRGSFSYTGYKEKRHKDRMSTSHNGPVVNGWEQNTIWMDDVFYMSRDARCNSSIELSQDTVTIVGWHDGYSRYRKKMRVFRKIEWAPDARTILVTDWAEGQSTDEVLHFTWYFLLNPVWIGEIRNGDLLLTSEDHTVRLEDSSKIGFSLTAGLYCPTYQVEASCQALKASMHMSLGEEVTFKLHY